MSTTAPHIDALLRDLKAALADLYGERLHRVVLYGSHARGEATDASDVDVMVVLHGEVNPMREISRLVEVTYPLELETGQLIAALPISVDDFTARDKPVVRHARAEGIEV